jgi:YHS domain-containing protein
MLQTMLTSGPRSVRALTLVAALALISTSGSAQAVNVDNTGLALTGYDPVAYFNAGHPTPGITAYTATWEGATYRFASSANREAFVADPARYLPAYGGYCAYGVAHGHKVKIDPDAWRIVDGRLYLNYSKGVQRQWLEDIAGFIATAERKWVELRDKPHD